MTDKALVNDFYNKFYKNRNIPDKEFRKMFYDQKNWARNYKYNYLITIIGAVLNLFFYFYGYSKMLEEHLQDWNWLLIVIGIILVGWNIFHIVEIRSPIPTLRNLDKQERVIYSILYNLEKMEVSALGYFVIIVILMISVICIYVFGEINSIFYFLLTIDSIFIANISSSIRARYGINRGRILKYHLYELIKFIECNEEKSDLEEIKNGSNKDSIFITHNNSQTLNIDLLPLITSDINVMGRDFLRFKIKDMERWVGLIYFALISSRLGNPSIYNDLKDCITKLITNLEDTVYIKDFNMITLLIKKSYSYISENLDKDLNVLLHKKLLRRINFEKISVYLSLISTIAGLFFI